MTPLLKGLSEERILLIKNAAAKSAKVPFPVKGIIRMVNAKGATIAIVIGHDSLAEIGEDAEASNPAFLKMLNESRASGRICSKEVKYKARLK